MRTHHLLLSSVLTLLLATDASAQGTITWQGGYPSAINVPVPPPPGLPFGGIKVFASQTTNMGWAFLVADVRVMDQTGQILQQSVALYDPNGSGNVGLPGQGGISSDHTFGGLTKNKYQVQIKATFRRYVMGAAEDKIVNGPTILVEIQ